MSSERKPKIIRSKEEKKYREELAKRKTLPRLDPNFLKKISDEANEIEHVKFEKAVIESLKVSEQRQKVEKKQGELNRILCDNPLSKYGYGKDFRKAKCEFYYDAIYQIMDLRIKLTEKVKAKYGEEVASAFMFSFRSEIQDIWANDGGNSIELEEKEKDLELENITLKNLESLKEDALQSIPRVCAGNIIDRKEDETDRAFYDKAEEVTNNSELVDEPTVFLGAKKITPIGGREDKEIEERSVEDLDVIIDEQLIPKLSTIINKKS